MVRHVDPSLHRRTLRRELRRGRTAGRMTQRHAAELLGWSPSKLIRIEAGQVGLSLRDLRSLLALYKVTDPDAVARIEKAARGSKGSSWWAKYHDLLSPQFSQYLGLEQAADLVRAFHPIVIPGHLQTAEYSAALLRPRVADSGRLQRLIEMRKERNDWLFDEDGDTTARFVVAEEALSKNPGSPQVVRGQLAWLLELGRHSRVEIAILPRTYPFHYSTLGSFVLLDFNDDDDLLYLEHATGSMTSGTDLALLAAYQECFDQIFEGALRGEDSAVRIEQAMAEVGGN